MSHKKKITQTHEDKYNYNQCECPKPALMAVRCCSTTRISLQQM